MATPVGDIVRQAAAAYDGIQSFEATETVAAGPISCEARVRFRKPDRIAVDYVRYEDPLAVFEDRLTGGAEFAPAELVGMHLVHDGSETWLHDPRTNVALRKPGRKLSAPLEPMSVLGEIGFLPSLAHDFLVRDEGEEAVDGRQAFRLGLRPKAAYRSLLLKEEVFPLSSAVLLLEKETSFPLRVEFRPAPETGLALLVGPRNSIRISYGNVRLNRAEETAFAPPVDARVFREEVVAADRLAERLPSRVSLERIGEAGYRIYGSRASLTSNEAADRGYATFALAPSTPEGQAPETVVSVRTGNYLSRNMARRRTLLAEGGEAVSLDGLPARLLDRTALVRDELPEGVERDLLELGWERDGVFWFLLGEGLGRPALLDLARALARREASGVPS